MPERARRTVYGVFRTYDDLTTSPVRRAIARTGPLAPYLALLLVWGLAAWRVALQLGNESYGTGFNVAWSTAIVAAAIVGTVWWWRARPPRRPARRTRGRRRR